MTQMVYVVMGESGEYSDRSEWPVAAYLDEAEATKHVVRATQKAKEVQATRPDTRGPTYFIYTLSIPPREYQRLRARLARELRESVEDESPGDGGPDEYEPGD